VAEKVVRLATCPVLTVPDRAATRIEAALERSITLTNAIRDRESYFKTPFSLSYPDARTTSTGSPEWRTTRLVTLPSTNRPIPERPWVHMAIRLSGVFFANSII
jgi:hypothetical protein